MANTVSSIEAGPSNASLVHHQRDGTTATPPAQQQQLPKLSSTFTKSQLAFALALVKTTPEAFSVKEYLLQLRKRIRFGKPVPPGSQRHVDSPEFWKEAYTSIYLEKKKLEDEVRSLKEERRRLRQSTPDSPVDDLYDASPVVRNPRKRAAPVPDFDEEEVEELETTPEEQDTVLRLSSYTLRIARQRSNLTQTIKASDHPDHIEDVFQFCIQSLSLLEATLNECTIPYLSLKTNSDSQIVTLLQHLMHQMDLLYRSCFLALEELCRTIIGRQKKSEIVYRLVMFFNKALEHLRTMCGLQAEQESDRRRQERSKRLRVTDDAEYVTNKYLTRMLVSSSSQIEWKVGQSGHSDVLEGILFSVIGRVGQLVSHAVFKEHVAASTRAGNITEEGPSMSVDAAKLETRYLIQVLHAALGTSPARKQLIVKVLADTSTISASQRQVSFLHSTDCILKTKKKIQSSLLKSTVGGTELASFRLPTLPEGHSDYVPPVLDVRSEKYGSEWLLESVWALLGWELAVDEPLPELIDVEPEVNSTVDQIMTNLRKVTNSPKADLGGASSAML